MLGGAHDVAEDRQAHADSRGGTVYRSNDRHFQIAQGKQQRVVGIAQRGAGTLAALPVRQVGTGAKAGGLRP